MKTKTENRGRSYASPHWRVETRVGEGRWATCRAQGHPEDPGEPLDCSTETEARSRADSWLYGAHRAPDDPVRIVRPDGSIAEYRARGVHGRKIIVIAPPTGAVPAS